MVRDSSRLERSQDAAAPIVIECAPEMTPDAWADHINLLVNSSVSAVIQLGRVLSEAKIKLQHGQWQALFKSGKVQINLRVAQRIMAIAHNQALSKTTNSSCLPASPDVLYTLSRLPSDDVEAHILARRIHPGMTIREARQLIKPVTQPEKEKQPAGDFEYHVEELINTILLKLNKVPDHLFVDVIAAVIEHLQEVHD